MVKLEGIIYKAFEQYVVLRGFAPIGDLAEVSEKVSAYQRDTKDDHKEDIVNFLASGEYKYFPEIILASRADRYSEFLTDIGGDADIGSKSAKYVHGLFIKSEYVPIKGNRARHASFDISAKELKRVDGNHRLEPFDEPGKWSYEADRDNISKIIVPYSIIFTNKETNDEFEAAIFNNINFKQLPLKQEKNIQNIHKYLKDSNELGKAHKLTINMIDLAEANYFKGIDHLSKKETEENEVYRTACLKIANLLIDKKQEAQIKRDEIEKELEKLDQTENKLSENSWELEIKEKKKKLKENAKEEIDKFIKKAENIEEIEIAIQSLRMVYGDMKDGNIGNLSMLAAFVYYKLINEAKFNSFVDWVMRNGINNLQINDGLCLNDVDSLIMLFEEIYEAKRREVFISMKFDDPQSELIFEKVRQSIEKFNKKKRVEITLTPIRIDQTVKSNSFTIPEEILHAISASSLLIADLSSCNVNVYHEIGYAMGVARAKNMEPSIILLYKTDTQLNKDKTDIDKFVGFNLRASSQLRFISYEELMYKLTKQLEVYFEI